MGGSSRGRSRGLLPSPPVSGTSPHRTTSWQAAQGPIPMPLGLGCLGPRRTAPTPNDAVPAPQRLSGSASGQAFVQIRILAENVGSGLGEVLPRFRKPLFDAGTK